MSDLPPDETVPDETPPEVVPPAEPPSLPDVLALLGLPADARALIWTPETVVAIAADYPEPYTPPTEEA